MSSKSRSVWFVASMTSVVLAANLAFAGVPVVGGDAGLDCWAGYPGRPEAWYMACCQMRYPRCWGGVYTEELCCQKQPPPGRRLSAADAQAAQQAGGIAAPSAGEEKLGVEVLEQYLGFSADEVQLLLRGLKSAAQAPLPPPPTLWVAPPVASEALGLPSLPPAPAPGEVRPHFRCLTPEDCSKEAFARLYQQGWATGILPLRHPWLVDKEDYLMGISVMDRMDNDGWAPYGHEATLERVQLAEMFRLSLKRIEELGGLPGERRCLEWDSSSYSRRFFGDRCAFNDVIVYHKDPAKWRTHTVQTGHRSYMVDILRADAIIPPESTSLVISCQVFEHLRKPHLAMEQLFKLMAPGGFVVWSAPLFSEVHASPEDFWRFTQFGAQALAEDAGFQVLLIYAPGSLRELAGYYMGITAPYWDKRELLADVGSSWPLQVYMLLYRPPLPASVAPAGTTAQAARRLARRQAWEGRNRSRVGGASAAGSGARRSPDAAVPGLAASPGF